MNAQQIADFATRIANEMDAAQINNFNRSVWYSNFCKTENNKLFDTYSIIVELIDTVESAVIVKKRELRKIEKISKVA